MIWYQTWQHQFVALIKCCSDYCARTVNISVTETLKQRLKELISNWEVRMDVVGDYSWRYCCGCCKPDDIWTITHSLLQFFPFLQLKKITAQLTCVIAGKGIWDMKGNCGWCNLECLPFVFLQSHYLAVSTSQL